MMPTTGTDAPAGVDLLAAPPMTTSGYTKPNVSATHLQTPQASTATPLAPLASETALGGTTATTTATTTKPGMGAKIAGFTRSAKDVAVNMPWVLLVLLGVLLTFIYLCWVATNLDGSANNYGSRRVYDQWIVMIIVLFYVPVMFIFTYKFPLPYNPAFQAFITTVSWVYTAELGDKMIDTIDYTNHSGYYDFVRLGFVGWLLIFIGNLTILLINLPTGHIWSSSHAQKDEISQV